jgi:hypothetical protein
MAQATLKEPESRAEPYTEEDAEAFYDRLEQFRETLSEGEQKILARMVVDASDGDGASSTAEAGTEEPSEDDIDSLADKLNQLHDELPGNQHLVLDALVGKTMLKDAADVEGYHWLFIRTVPNRRIGAWRAYCGQIGGDTFVQRWRPRGGHRTVGCWEADY